VKVRSKIFGALAVAALATALSLVGGGAAAQATPASVHPAAGTVRPLNLGAAFTIENRGSHKCLDGEQSIKPSPVVQWGCSSTAPTQNWLMEPIQSQPGWSTLRNVQSNLCLDLRAADNNPVVNGTAIQQYFCFADSISTERWVATPAFNVPGYLTFTNQVLNKCLDLNNGSSANGAKVQVWDCDSGNNNQLWRQG